MLSRFIKRLGVEKVSTATWIVFIGALITVAGGIVAAVGTVMIARDQQREQQENVNIIKGLKEQLVNSARDARAEARALADGGASYGYVTFYGDDDIPNQFLMMLRHEGAYPLYDVKVRISDSTKLNTIDLTKVPRGKRQNVIKLYEREIPVGNVGIGQVVTLPSFALEDGVTEQAYYIWVTARNGTCHQNVRLRKVDGKWLYANEVQGSHIPMKMVQLSEGFPRDDKGEILW